MSKEKLRVCDWPVGGVGKHALLALLLEVREDGSLARPWYSARELELATGLTAPTVNRALREMRQVGIVTRAAGRPAASFSVGPREDLAVALAELLAVMADLPTDLVEDTPVPED